MLVITFYCHQSLIADIFRDFLNGEGVDDFPIEPRQVGGGAINGGHCIVTCTFQTDEQVFYVNQGLSALHLLGQIWGVRQIHHEEGEYDRI